MRNLQNPLRKKIRLTEYDYSQNGAYFITLCSYNKECLFGEIKDEQMIMNDLGMIVFNEWLKSAAIRSEITLDDFVVMPNHFHGIAVICRNDTPIDLTRNCAGGQTGDRPVAHTKQQGAPKSGPRRESIGALLSGFKSAVTKQVNAVRRTHGQPVWQRNYYEHIIRNEESLCKIKEYILSNPMNWHRDRLNPVNYVDV
jgi:REP element-mobilizing transposase RayT